MDIVQQKVITNANTAQINSKSDKFMYDKFDEDFQSTCRYLSLLNAEDDT